MNRLGRHRWLRWLLAGLAGCFWAVLAPYALGQTTIDWNGMGDGTTYGDSNNWTGGNVPDSASENARFDLPAETYDVQLQANTTTTVNDLLVRAETITFASDGVNSAMYTVTDTFSFTGNLFNLSDAGGAGDVLLTASDLGVGNGTVNVLDGSHLSVSNLFRVGNSAGTGFLTVSGTNGNSTFQVTGNNTHTLGRNGNMGVLTISDHSTGNSIAGTLALADSGIPNSSGSLGVGNGSDLMLGNLVVGPGTETGQSATVTV